MKNKRHKTKRQKNRVRKKNMKMKKYKIRSNQSCKSCLLIIYLKIKLSLILEIS